MFHFCPDNQRVNKFLNDFNVYLDAREAECLIN